MTLARDVDALSRTNLPVPVPQPGTRTTDGRLYRLHSDAQVLPFEEHLRCTSDLHRQPGVRCKNTAIRGGSVCPLHGGAASQVRQAAARRVEAERLNGDVSKLLAELEVEQLDVHPLDSLLDAKSRASAMVVALSSLLDDPTSSRGQLASEQYGRWLDRVTKISDVCLRADVDARYLALNEAKAETIGRVLLDALRSGWAAADATIRAELDARADHFGFAQTPGDLTRLLDRARSALVAAMRAEVARQQQHRSTQT